MLFKKIPQGALDIVGDVHGEWEALNKLIKRLGYQEDGSHPQGRKLVFLGDLVDRGPQSVTVLKWVMKGVEEGRILALLGNHEMNILRQEVKDGNGWFFGENSQDKKYEPYEKAIDADKRAFLEFFDSLPLVLEREDIRLVHATWDNQSIEALKPFMDKKPSQAFEYFHHWIEEQLEFTGLRDLSEKERNHYRDAILDEQSVPPMLHGISEINLIRQMQNPIRILVSGKEKNAQAPFFSSGEWRFVERMSWWDFYQEDVPVVVGHYWRDPRPKKERGQGHAQNFFDDLEFNEWHGAKKQVFCVDFSVGARYRERNSGAVKESKEPQEMQVQRKTQLAALRWPEKTLVFDDHPFEVSTEFTKPHAK